MTTNNIEAPDEIAIRLTEEHGAERALEICDGLASFRYPSKKRDAYRIAAKIIAAVIEDGAE